MCLKSTSILSLSASDYTPLISIPSDSQTYEIKVNLKKDRRTGSKEFTILLKKPLTSKNAEGSGPDLSELIVISPLSRGGSPELLIGISFLDKKLNILEYSYFWSMRHFKNENQYLNGRKEPILKVLNDDILTGSNDVSVEVTDPKSGKTYIKNYSHEKGRAPYGGNCVVSPMTGISMKTEFKFIVQNWITKSLPMIYKIKYLNKDNNYIEISKGGFPETNWSTNLIPVAKDFVVEVTDASGLSSLNPCSIKVKPNPELANLDTYLEKEFDPNIRLMLVEIYKSNKENLKDSEKDPSLNNKALDVMSYYLTNSLDSIQEDLENIIARILDISNQQFDKEKLIIVNNSIKVIVDNIEPLLQYKEKMQNVYRILDNIFKKASEMEEFKSDKDLLDLLQYYLNKLNTKLFTNIINGQALLIANESYDTQMNKVSKLNVPTLEINYDTPEEKHSKCLSNRNKRKRTKIRYLSIPDAASPQQNCEDSIAAICIPPGNITSIIESTGTNGVGFQGQLNHKQNLPIAEKQFSNSLDFDLSEEKKDGKQRKLNVEQLNIRFEIRLKMPVVKDNTVVQEATCVQYTQKKADTSCDSWYDVNTNEVVCSCIKQGLTVNVMDKALSSLSKLKQFPTLSADICKTFWFLILFIFL